MSHPQRLKNKSKRRYPNPPSTAVQPCVTTVLGPGYLSSSLKMNITDAGPIWPKYVFQYVGSTPAHTHTTVPTSACAKHNVRRSNRVQHGESMPQLRVEGCNPLYCARTRPDGARDGGMVYRDTPSPKVRVRLCVERWKHVGRS